MYKTYLKLALASIKENPLVSIISVCGIAITIAVAMVIVMVVQVQTANFHPETKRDRMLYVNGVQVKDKTNPDDFYYNFMSLHFYNECFAKLKTAEAATAVSSLGLSIQVSLPKQENYRKELVLSTDDKFWKIFDFQFVDGQGYSKEEFDASVAKVVVCEGLARSLFKRSNVVGETVLLNFKPYTIVGVVKDVSRVAHNVYARLWIPINKEDHYEIDGSLAAYILAKKPSDFDAIRAEVYENINKFNANQQQYIADIGVQPYNRYMQMIKGHYSYSDMRLTDYFTEKGLAVLFFILLPAIYLTIIGLARIRKRYSEFGIRKTFGASKKQLLIQVFSENVVITIIGGFVGLLLSIVLLYTGKHLLLNSLYSFEDGVNQSISLSFNMIFKPLLFFAILLFCAITNTLSTLLPAWCIAKQKIVAALHNE